MVHNTILFLSFAMLIALPFAESAAYCTYHNYNAGDSLTTVACSDGANGVMTKFGYNNLSPMFPYVTAFSGATWNSPNCGRCVQVSSGGRSVFLTVIDQCGPAPGGYDAHFDIAPPAFRELFGDAGVNAGVQSADWKFVSESQCRGNKGNSGSPPSGGGNSGPPVVSPPPKGGASSTRCGWDWSDANGKCGTPCSTNDGPCAGQKCYADLSMSPCNHATEDDTTSFDGTDDLTVDAAFADTSSFDETDEGNFVDDVSMNTETVDAAIADTTFDTEAENFDAAFTDVVEEDNYVDNFVDSAMVDAAVADSFETDDSNFVANDDQNYVDAAVAGEGFSAGNTQQTQSASTGMQGWMVAIVVVFSISTVLLLVVIVLAISVLRKH